MLVCGEEKQGNTMKRKAEGKSDRRKTEKSPGAVPHEQDSATTIVALGASAGGIEAVTDFLNYLPANTGMGLCWCNTWTRNITAS
jgi:chemotaxis response regulator CheB